MENSVVDSARGKPLQDTDHIKFVNASVADLGRKCQNRLAEYVVDNY